MEKASGLGPQDVEDFGKPEVEYMYLFWGLYAEIYVQFCPFRGIRKIHAIRIRVLERPLVVHSFIANLNLPRRHHGFVDLPLLGFGNIPTGTDWPRWGSSHRNSAGTSSKCFQQLKLRCFRRTPVNSQLLLPKYFKIQAPMVQSCRQLLPLRQRVESPNSTMLPSFRRGLHPKETLFDHQQFPWQPPMTSQSATQYSLLVKHRPETKEEVEALVSDRFQETAPGIHVEMDMSWEQLGLDSLSSIALARSLSDALGLAVEASSILDVGSPSSLVSSLWSQLSEGAAGAGNVPAGAGQPTPLQAHAWRNTDTRGCRLPPCAWNPKPGKVLYICPPFGFGRSYFGSWVRWLGDMYEVHILGGPQSTWNACVEANAAYIEATRGSRPFALFGHSFGAIAAFETCAHLQERQSEMREMPEVLVVSGAPPPMMFEWKSGMAPFSQCDVQNADQVRTVLCDFHLMDVSMDVVTDDLLLAELSLVQSYKARPSFRLTCPILGIHANNDVLIPSSRSVAGWSVYTVSHFAMHLIDGTHFYFFRPPAAFFAPLKTSTSWLRAECADCPSWPGPGVYELLSFWWGTEELHTYPFGTSPQGCLIYMDGHVFVHLCDPHVACSSSLSAAYAQAFYHGTYDVENGAVFHNIDMSSNPNEHGDALGRYFQWNADERKLSLSTRPDSLRAAGGTLEWQCPLTQPQVSSEFFGVWRLVSAPGLRLSAGMTVIHPVKRLILQLQEPARALMPDADPEFVDPNLWLQNLSTCMSLVCEVAVGTGQLVLKVLMASPQPGPNHPVAPAEILLWTQDVEQLPDGTKQLKLVTGEGLQLIFEPAGQ